MVVHSMQVHEFLETKRRFEHMFDKIYDALKTRREHMDGYRLFFKFTDNLNLWWRQELRERALCAIVMTTKRSIDNICRDPVAFLALLPSEELRLVGAWLIRILLQFKESWRLRLSTMYKHRVPGEPWPPVFDSWLGQVLLDGSRAPYIQDSPPIKP